MTTSAKGQYPAHSHARGMTSFSIVFQGANVADPTASLTEDPGGVISAVTRTAEGVYKVPLKRKYGMVHAMADANSDLDVDASVTNVVDGGAAANYIEVTCQTGAGTNDDLDAINITVIGF